jgi:hypothetical protein
MPTNMLTSKVICTMNMNHVTYAVWIKENKSMSLLEGKYTCKLITIKGFNNMQATELLQPVS